MFQKRKSPTPYADNYSSKQFGEVQPVQVRVRPTISAGEDGQMQTAPLRKHTQEDQDKEDEMARRRAMKGLVDSWMDRLQLISLIVSPRLSAYVYESTKVSNRQLSSRR